MSEKKIKLNFLVRTNTSAFLQKHLNKGKLVDSSFLLLDGVDAKIVSEKIISEGVSKNEIAVGFIIGVASGVPAGVIANRIYDYLMENGKNEIIIQEERITILNKDELIEYINSKYTIKK